MTTTDRNIEDIAKMIDSQQENFQLIFSYHDVMKRKREEADVEMGVLKDELEDLKKREEELKRE
eukprot:CAMPEP_0194309128 /NCGR_PEP_ID=MMETSP0171-20130528/6102_1 /TAXON_ID=218684 /ORGANISM="Corethron pennatum, Strain L29A3" /LENGTH=63 /DNA_ID=CAMNT_0039062135 /DNA_START=74 /DNA_END=262 /DNA_ORIENTATION=-